jgi:hypothetical protein
LATRSGFEEFEETQRVLVDFVQARDVPAEDGLGKDDHGTDDAYVGVDGEAVEVERRDLERDALVPVQHGHARLCVVHIAECARIKGFQSRRRITSKRKRIFLVF